MSTLLKSSFKFIITTVIICGVMALDQYTKTIVLDSLLLKQNPFIKVTDFFNFTLVWNTGISFGLFNTGIYSNHIFLSLATIVTLIMTYLLVFAHSKVSQISYSLIIGGALGNIIDRLYNGAVLDFIELHVSNYYWPAFNVADSSICIGAFLLVFDMIVNELKIKTI